MSMRSKMLIAVVLTLVMGIFANGHGASTPTASAQEATPAAEELEGSMAAGTGPDKLTPVLASIIGRETTPVLGSDGKFYVVYELLLTNTTNAPTSLEAVTVLDAEDGSEVLRLDAEAKEEALRLLDREPAADAVLPPDAGRILMLAVIFDTTDESPAALTHCIETLGQSAFSADNAPFSYVTAEISLGGEAAPALSPPPAGEGWITAEGCCSLASHHRNGVFAINGHFAVGQRFAIDYIRIDDEGRLVEGDPSQQENWVGYQAPVLAADGVVVSSLDELPNQVPTIMPVKAR